MIGKVLKGHILPSMLPSKGSEFDRNPNMSCLVLGTFPFNFQTDVYFKGNSIHVALNYVQQIPLRDTILGVFL